MLIVLGMSTIFGAIKGLAWQIASLASIVVSYIVACRYRGQVAQMIDTQPPWNMFLAMLILYAGTGFVIWVGFRLMSSAIDKIRLKTFDRHLGALFGLGKGVVFCLLITMFAMTLLGARQQAAICQSRSGYYISAFLDKAVVILPEEVHSTIGGYLAKLDNQLKQGQQNQFGADPNGAFGSPNLSNLTNDLKQLIPQQLNDLIPQGNPNAWPNPSTQSQPNGFPGLGGPGNAQNPNFQNSGNFGPSGLSGGQNGFNAEQNGQNQNFLPGGFQSQPNGFGTAERPNGVYPR